MSEVMQNMPPQSIEAEQAVLGAIMIDADRLISASERLLPQDFYRASHQRIFEAMLVLSDRGEAIELVTVTAELSTVGILDEIGGLPYLAELAEGVPTAANINYYVNVVDQKSTLRRLIRTAGEIVTDGYERQNEVDVLLNEAERKILEVSQGKGSASFIPI
jgi:replicative DNA helicase